MEISQFDTKYSLDNISDFVKCLSDSKNDENIESSVFYKISKPFTKKSVETEEDYESEISENNYKLIKYNKKLLEKKNYSTHGLIRSVVVDKENRVVSFSPPKCITYDEFIMKYPNQDENIIVEELIEGTMVQLFWDSYESKWEIATKSSICGYNTNTFTKMTFRDMFFDTLKEMNMTLDIFNHQYCYSFVLQHPKNPIVFDIVKPQLYLLYVYYINHVYNMCDDSQDDITSPVSGKEEIMVQVHHLNHFKGVQPKITFPNDCKLKYPKKFVSRELKTYKNVCEYFYTYNYDTTMTYSTMGFVIYNKVTGERCKIRNPYYEHMHNIHGRQSKLLYKYLIARQLNTVNQFIKCNSKNNVIAKDDGVKEEGEVRENNTENIKNMIDLFKTKIHSFTNILLIHYIDCFINKSKPLSEYEPQYKSHMYELHHLYLRELKPMNKHMNLHTVMTYVNNLHPSKLIYSLINKKPNKHNK
jgi:hypothetical protein